MRDTSQYRPVTFAALVGCCFALALPAALTAQTAEPGVRRVLDYRAAEVISEPVEVEEVPPPGSLDELEQLAMANHPALQRAWAEVRRAEGEAIQARMYPNPQLGFGVPQFAGDESQYNVTIGQEFLTGGKLQLSSSALWQGVTRARHAVERTRFQVLTDVRQQFFAALAAQQRVAVLRQLSAIARRSLELGEAQFAGGNAARSDVLLLEIELNKAEVAQQTAEVAYDARLRQLAAAVGLPELPIPALHGNLDAVLPDIELVETQQQAVTANARVRMAEAQIRRSRLELQRAEVEPSPTFQISGGYQYQASPIHDQATMQVLMSVPLWNRNQGGIRAARAGIQQAIAERREVTAALAGEVADAMRRYKSAEQLVDRYRSDIVPRSQETVELTQQLFEQGEVDFLRLLQAQRSMIEVNLSYIDAQENRWLAAAELAGLLQLDNFLP